VTHDEVRALLPRYAAADLDLAEAARVRAHLATACVECLHDVFSRPIGVRRAVLPPAAVPPPGERPEPVLPESPWRRVLPAARIVALAGLAAWAVYQLRGYEARQSTQIATRLAELESQRAGLSASLGKAERDLEETRSAERRREAPAAEPGPQNEVVPGGAGKEPERTSAPAIRYANDTLSIRVVAMPLREVLEEIARQSGAAVVGQASVEREVSAEFEDVPLPEALHRLLGEQNFVLVYDNQRRPRIVELVSVPARSASLPPEAVPARRQPPLEAAVALLERYPPVRLKTELADALGTETLPLRQLIALALYNEVKEVRSEAMRASLAALEADADLRAAVVGSLAAMDDAFLGTLVRGLAGERTEEALFYVATQASGELRIKAARLLEQLHAETRVVQPAG
jgi:hypothetical protein